MNVSAARLTLLEAAPELARQLRVILFGLAGVIARRFLREPRLVGLIVPLWRRLTHAAGRFERAVARPARARSRSSGGGRAPGLRLPSGRGWLVRELGYEAVGYGSQLAHVLAGPEMQAVLAAVPGVGRILRPVCWMLGLADVVAVAPVAAVETRAKVAKPWPCVLNEGKAAAPGLSVVLAIQA